MLDLTGKTILVTGADGGVGTGICRQLANFGADVVVHTMDATDKTRELVVALKELGSDSEIVEGNICDPLNCQKIVSNVVERYGRLDGLINNAGVQPLVSFEEITPEQWSFVLEVNATGTHLITKAAAMFMKDYGGSIVHIASVEASTPAPNHIHYDVSKAGVKMHARAAALELGKHCIRVNTVSPGLVNRGDIASEWPEGYQSWMRSVPIKRTAIPEDIGNACSFLMSDLAAFVSGHDLVVDGGMSAVQGW